MSQGLPAAAAAAAEDDDEEILPSLGGRRGLRDQDLPSHGFSRRRHRLLLERRQQRRRTKRPRLLLAGVAGKEMGAFRFLVTTAKEVRGLLLAVAFSQFEPMDKNSEEKARKKIYSVLTRHYFASGAHVSEELSSKLKELPKVRWVIPDSYSVAKNKDYGGEPFINGKAVPYDTKYHEECLRSTHRHNCSVRRDNTENFQSRDVPTGRPRSKSPSPQCQQTTEPHDVPPVHQAQNNMPMPPPPSSPNNSDPPTYQHNVQSPQACDAPSFGQNCQHCGAPVHKVGNQDIQDSPDARMRDDNNGCQRGRLDYQNGSAEADQTTLHGDNTPPRQSGSEPGIQGQEVHHHCYCNVHYHYYY